MSITENQTASQQEENEKSSPRRPKDFKKFNRWLWGLVVFALVGSGVTLWRVLTGRNSQPQVAPLPSTPVMQQEVVTSTVVESSEFVGALEAQQRALVRPEAEGRIVEIFVESGDRVRAGTPLMQLRPDRNQAQVNAAAANVEVQKGAIENARAALRVAEAQLAEVRSDREAAAAEVRRQEAEVVLQQEEFARADFLVTQGAQAQQALDIQTRNIESAIASRDAALKTLNASEAAVNAALERVSAAKATLERETAALARVQAEVDVASEDLQFYQVVAPIDGVVGDIPVNVGDYASFGNLLTTVIQNETLELRLPVPAEYASQLSMGLPVELRTENTGEPLGTGKISFVSPRVIRGEQTILAKATFANPNRILRDEQLARARVVWNAAEGVLVPTTAVFRIGGQAFVYVVDTDEDSHQVARQVPVTLGEIQENSYHILEGIEPGTTIVTSGLLNLSDGAAIAPQLETSTEE